MIHVIINITNPLWETSFSTNWFSSINHLLDFMTKLWCYLNLCYSFKQSILSITEKIIWNCNLEAVFFYKNMILLPTCTALNELYNFLKNLKTWLSFIVCLDFPKRLRTPFFLHFKLLCWVLFVGWKWKILCTCTK